MNEKYHRVIPRDLFNEAKLLKCVGKICLDIHDNKLPITVEFNDEEEGFIAALLEEGYLIVVNLSFFIGNKDIQFVTTYNSRLNWPLICIIDDEWITVFEDDGSYEDEFIERCNSLKED